MDHQSEDENSKTIALVNEGAFLLLKKDYEESCSCSRNAIQYLKSKMQELVIPEGNEAQALDRETNLQIEFRDADVDDHLADNNSDESTRSGLEGVGSPFICTSTMVISLSPGHKTVTISDHFRMIAAAMYNLALGSHLQALERTTSTEDRGARLYRSLQCYEVAYRLQMQRQLNMGFILTLSVVNNMGAIYLSLQDPTRSDSCFQTLLASMTYLKESGSFPSPRSCYDVEPHVKETTWNGFWTNVTGLVLRNPSSADAA